MSFAFLGDSPGRHVSRLPPAPQTPWGMELPPHRPHSRALQPRGGSSPPGCVEPPAHTVPVAETPCLNPQGN